MVGKKGYGKMKKKFLSLVTLGLISVPLATNAEAWSSMHFSYSEDYFVVKDSSLEAFGDNMKEFNRLTFYSVGIAGKVALKKDAHIGSFDTSATPMTYVVNGNNVVSEFMSAYDTHKYIIEGDGSLTVYGVYTGGKDVIDSETIKTAYYNDTCVKEDEDTCYYFKTNEDLKNKFASLKELGANSKMDSSLTVDDFINGENNARITSDENHKWITEDWVNERVTTDMKVTYNENGTVTFSSEKNEDIYSLKNNDVTFTSKNPLNPSYTLVVNSVDASKLVLDKYTPIKGYDISVLSGTEIVPIENGEFEIKIPVDVKYDKFVVCYIEDGSVKETFDATYNDGYVTFKTTHLSEYAVFGMNEEKEKNPQTGDNIFMIFAGFIVSGLALIGLELKKLKRN